jgi:hypothetical protein
MEFKTLKDAFTPEGKAKLAEFTKSSPEQDKVFAFPTKGVVDESGACLAGSSVLAEIMKVYNPEAKTEWDTDYDFFFLGMDSPARLKTGMVDIIHSQHKTVPNLLLNFDLPPCRIARNATTLWASAHCLNAIVTGEYPFPSNLQHTADEWKFSRTAERMEKYEKRGFLAVKYVHSKPPKLSQVGLSDCYKAPEKTQESWTQTLRRFMGLTL